MVANADARRAITDVLSCVDAALLDLGDACVGVPMQAEPFYVALGRLVAGRARLVKELEALEDESHPVLGTDMEGRKWR